MISGVNSLVLDLDYGSDILDNGHFAALIVFCVKHRVRGVMIAHACDFCSKARRAPAWSRMPFRLRSPACPTGLPELSGKDLETCQLGNKTLAQTTSLIRILRRKHILFIIENPTLGTCLRWFVLPEPQTQLQLASAATNVSMALHGRSLRSV